MEPINVFAQSWIWLAAIAVIAAFYFAWKRGRARPHPAGWDAGAQASGPATHGHATHAVRPPARAGEPAERDAQRPQAHPEPTSGGHRRHGCC